MRARSSKHKRPARQQAPRVVFTHANDVRFSSSISQPLHSSNAQLSPPPPAPARQRVRPARRSAASRTHTRSAACTLTGAIAIRETPIPQTRGTPRSGARPRWSSWSDSSRRSPVADSSLHTCPIRKTGLARLLRPAPMAAGGLRGRAGCVSLLRHARAAPATVPGVRHTVAPLRSRVSGGLVGPPRGTAASGMAPA
jgi:hypothetical protein